MVLLTSHLLNGQRIGVDIPLNSIIKVPFKIESSPSAGYADISSVENWWNYGKDLEDFLYVRKRIQILTREKGIVNCIATLSTPPLNPTSGDRYYIDIEAPATDEWAGYEGWCATWDGVDWIREPAEWIGYRYSTEAEKDILAQLKVGSQGDHFADYGVPAIVDYGLDYHITSRDTREYRMLRATVEVYNIIPLNAAESLGDITASPLGDMYNRYIEFGVKGTLEDYNKDFNPNPTPGICDWLLSRAPFNNQEPFVSSGYPSGLTLKVWNPIDATTINDFATKIYNILVYGTSNPPI